jgi:CDP-glycerol glycerophosphotransferase
MGNPYYIIQYLLQEPKYKDLQLVVAGGADAKKALKTLPNHQLIKTCSVHSIDYCYWLAVAEFLINDVTFPVYFSRRDGQKYLNTWHGTPLKTLGRKIAYNPFFLSNTQRNFLHATHILSPNVHTEDVLLRDYMIEHIWNGKVLRNGYPRNDLFSNGQLNTEETIAIQKKFNIAFMPTWRGTSADMKLSAKIQQREIIELLSYLEENLPEKINLWVRLHPLVKGKLYLANFQKIKEFLVGAEPYDFISRCDALITDYSSVMFDFSITRKPILLFVPDENKYVSERNFCLDFSKIPFIKTKTYTELHHGILEIADGKFKISPEYEAFVKEFCPYDHASSTAVLCSKFFNNLFIPEKGSNNNEIASQKNILIFVGTFWNNGITSSLKNLLSNIDKDRYNLFIWIDKSEGEKNATDFFSDLDPRINYIPTQNYLSAGIMETFHFFGQYFFSKNYSLNDNFLTTLWQREYKRMFGKTTFDAIIHFTGYERRVALIMSSMNTQNTKRLIYVHNDMFLENNHGKNFDPRAIELAYQSAEKIAAVRIDVTDNYCHDILDISSKVHYVPNCLSISYRELAQTDILDSLSYESRREKSEEILSALKQKNTFRFINLARFSWEKGQQRLIEAFEQVWTHHPNSQLFILGGYGKAFKSLIKRHKKSPAAESIFILIGSNNIFPLLSKMDVMILASFYEGLPMVIFESLALNIPVISTDIPGPSEFLKNGYGLVVENSVTGLTNGMLAGINKQIPFKPYDFYKHNHDAIERFYSLIDD